MSKKHTILMLLGCVVGMGGAAVILFFRIPVGNLVPILLILLCPLSHILMMNFMMKDGHDHGTSVQPAIDSHHVHPSPANENR